MSFDKIAETIHQPTDLQLKLWTVPDEPRFFLALYPNTPITVNTDSNGKIGTLKISSPELTDTYRKPINIDYLADTDGENQLYRNSVIRLHDKFPSEIHEVGVLNYSIESDVIPQLSDPIKIKAHLLPHKF